MIKGAYKYSEVDRVAGGYKRVGFRCIYWVLYVVRLTVCFV